MEFNFKGFVYCIIAIAGITFYVSTHYTLEDVLGYAKKHPDLDISPKLVYYAGFGYYMRSDYDKAETAFNQLLTDYTTGSVYAPHAMYLIGDAYDEQQKYTDARNTWDQYRELWPDGPDKRSIDTKYEFIKFK